MLHAIQPMTPEEIADTHGARAVRAGRDRRRRRCRATAQEPDVPPELDDRDLRRARFEVENWRWAGVPFYLRTGKRLPKRDTEITIEFRRAPLLLLPAARHAAAEPAGDPHPARRAHLAALPRQVPGPADPSRAGGDDFAYSDLRGRQPQHRLRDAALRLHDRRRHAVPPRRHGRRGVAHRHAHPRGVGRARRRRLPELRRRHLGTRGARTS